MTGMRPRRLQLWADPSKLTEFDAVSAHREARRRLGELRDDVKVMRIQRLAADSIEVVLLVAPPVHDEDFDEIAAVLRETLGTGPGRTLLIPDELDRVRGIGGQGRTCPCCGAPDGSHVRDCPEERS